MRMKPRQLILILLCAAPLALAACQNHEHPGDSADTSSSSDEHPGDSGSASGESDASSSEHPGDS